MVNTTHTHARKRVKSDICHVFVVDPGLCSLPSLCRHEPAGPKPRAPDSRGPRLTNNRLGVKRTCTFINYLSTKEKIFTKKKWNFYSSTSFYTRLHASFLFFNCRSQFESELRLRAAVNFDFFFSFSQSVLSLCKREKYKCPPIIILDFTIISESVLVIRTLLAHFSGIRRIFSC